MPPIPPRATPYRSWDIGRDENIARRAVDLLSAGIQGERRPRDVAVLAELAARLRRGELLGLKWEDIDLDRGGLWVKRHGARINGEVVASLKTKNADQTLPSAEDTIQVLKQQRKKRQQPLGVPLSHRLGLISPHSVLHTLHPGAEAGGSASGQVPRFTAHIRNAGPPERGRHQDDIRDAGALQRGVHPAYQCPRHHSGPEGGGKNHRKSSGAFAL